MLISNTNTLAKLFNTTCKNVDNTDFTGVSIDSRNCLNQLFVAIVGENLDGHNFIADAINNGCKAVVVSKKHNFNIPTIVVDDTTKALGQIASFHKQNINPTTIAITGSNGKTTTKNMLYNIFNQIAPTLKTAGNFNNHIGVPLTLLNLKPDHKFAIIEMGANHLGEIAYLRDITKPDISCVINTLDAHIGEFGGKENLIKAKCEIFDETSINIVNQNTYCPHNFKADIIFGKESDITYNDLQNIELKLLGKHNQENALASIAIAKSVGINDNIIKQGLEATEAEQFRMQLIQKGDNQIIADFYNASPSATKYALKTLSEYSGEKVAVLGNIAELGDKSSEIHAKIGEYAKSLNIDFLYGFGDMAKNYNIQHFDNINDLISKLKNHHNSTILLKASRSARFENILNKI